MLIHSFPHYLQQESADCGPSCLRMIAKYYGKAYSAEMLRKRCFISREGVSMLGISDAAESIGFRTVGLLEVLMTAFFILGIIGLICVVIKRKKKGLAFPFYPFLTVGYLLGVCIGGI